MSTVGIIAEYNPFHTGHAYQIAKAREISGAEHVVVIMSGDFVQRGAPSLMDKYLRTRMALEGGADLVVELPVWIATASAADFAQGAVSILDALGCVDFLCFGSEAGEMKHLSRAAALFLEEPDSFKTVLKYQLSQGKSFPKARKAAWEAATGENGDFLDLPNNILGISYLMALKKQNSSIRPLTVSRKGSFHSSDLNQEFASASALRQRLANQKPDDTILAFFPGETIQYLMKQAYGTSYPVEREDFWPVLKARLLSEAEQAAEYADFPVELANRLKSCHFTCTSYEELATCLKTAAFTRSRIDRGLLHLLLDIRQTDVDYLKTEGSAFYARVLGFRKSHASLLKEITENSRIPVLTKAMPPADFPPAAALSYRMDTQAANLYESMKGLRYASPERDNQQNRSDTDSCGCCGNLETKPVHEFRQKLILAE